MQSYLSNQGVKELEKKFDRDRRIWELVDLIVSEWDSDPMSVQCFDLRIVQEIKQLLEDHKKEGLFF